MVFQAALPNELWTKVFKLMPRDDDVFTDSSRSIFTVQPRAEIASRFCARRKDMLAIALTCRRFNQCGAYSPEFLLPFAQLHRDCREDLACVTGLRCVMRGSPKTPRQSMADTSLCHSTSGTLERRCLGSETQRTELYCPQKDA